MTNFMEENSSVSSKITYAFTPLTNTSHFQVSISDTVQTGICRDFPGHPVVRIPPSKARDADPTAAQETKILHAVGKPSLCTTTKEALVLSSPCSATREATSVKSPCARTRE